MARRRFSASRPSYGPARKVDLALTWSDFITACQRPPVWSESSCYSAIDSGHDLWGAMGRSFFKTATYQEAIDLLTHGWTEGRDKIKDGLAAARPTVAAPARFFDVAGAYPIVPLAVAGEPACMVTTGTEDTRRASVIRLVAAGSASATIAADMLINRGVGICAAIDALEQDGHRVELVVAFHAEHEGETFKAEITVKDANQPLELDRVAFAFAHPSMTRRCQFRLIEQHCSKRFQGNYGSPRPLTVPAGSVMVDHAGIGNYGSPREAYRTVAAALARQGITFEEEDAGNP